MQRIDKQLPYDPTDKQSIFYYATSLKGSTLRKTTGAEKLPGGKKNKGAFGNAVETYFFKLNQNSDSSADFKEAGLELKTTPLKQNKNGSLSAKERLSLGMIDYKEVVHETFEKSHLMQKAHDILLISYLWKPDENPLDHRIELVEMVSLSKLPKGDLAQIKTDWETIVNKVREGKAHEISGTDTLYLEAATKSSGSEKRREQPYSPIKAKPRAWALKASFMTAMSNRIIDRMQSIERADDEQNLTLIDLVRKRFEPYLGLTEEELGIRFGYLSPNQNRRKPKNLCALITRKILGVSEDAKIEELEKAGAKPKTMRLRRNGTPKESMSFPRFDYFDLVRTPFEESNFAEYLSQTYLFVIYQEDPYTKDQYRLVDVAFWQMPESDIPEAKRCYEEMRGRVASGHAEQSVKSSENRCCHVRPHDTKTSKPIPTPQGEPMKRKCFWLNAQYLKTEVSRIRKNSL